MYARHYWDGERQGSGEVLGDKSAPVLLCLPRLTFIVLRLNTDVRNENPDLCEL